MAITGLVVMSLSGDKEELKSRLAGMEGLSVYGSAPDGSLVCVLEAHSRELEDRLRAISEMEGVTAVLPASVNMEDELEASGAV